MSLFGTFRRKGKKNSVDEFTSSPPITSGGGIRASGVYNSTPNLNRVDLEVKKISKVKNNETKTAVSTTKWHFGGDRRSSSSVETWTGSGTGDNNAQPPWDTQSRQGDKPEGSSLKRFASMMSFSLRKTRSSRKLGFGSTLNVAKDEKQSPSTAEPVNSSKSDAMFYSLPRTKKKFVNRPSTNEVTLGDDGVPGENSDSARTSLTSGILRNDDLSHKSSTNTEPGVISSGSSSENNSVHDVQSIRASSEKSDIMEESEEDDESHRVEKDPQEIERQKTLLMGIKKFNLDPKKGIEFLHGKHLLEYTPEGVAEFLKEAKGLSKACIGNYLGERIDFNEEVLKAFVDRHDFQNLILVEALRQFLWSFKLPGESQKISRMLDAFADRYCQLNPGIYPGDTCSVLCYSIIMLNTELHNPNVKEKITVNQFIKRNQGIEGGESLSTPSMISMYNSILTEPFRFPEEDGNDLMLTFFNPAIEGWLYKFGGRPRSWKRLWFILSNNCLYYFRFTTDKTPRGIIPLENILVKVPQDKPGKLFSLILYKDSPDPRIVDHIKTCKTLSDGQIVPKLYSSIQLGTSDKKERDRWVRCVNANHSMSRFYSDLTLKKMKANKKSKSHLEDDTFKPKGVRKSQISLPATALGIERAPIPKEVLLDPTKDPKNFFIQRNLSSISLAHSISTEEEVRLRSKSESRLYDRLRGMSCSSSTSPSVSTLSHTDSSFSRDIRDLDSTSVPGEMESIPLPPQEIVGEYHQETLVGRDAPVISLNPSSLSTEIVRNKETDKSFLHYHLNKKLSNIAERDSSALLLSRNNEVADVQKGSCDTIDIPNHPNLASSEHKTNATLSEIDRQVESERKSSLSSNVKETELVASEVRRNSSIPKFSNDEDGSSTCSSVEVFQYGEPSSSNTVRLLTYKSSTDESSEQKVCHYIQDMYYNNSVYESNV